MKSTLRRSALTCVAGTLAFLCGEACHPSEKIKRDQYYAEGSRLYTLYCANCHQQDGSGMAQLYPPLHYPREKERFICIVKHGLSEETVVNNVTYNRPMPGNPRLTDIEIAEIATYVYNTWGKETTYTPIDSVKAALRNCSQTAGAVLHADSTRNTPERHL